MCITLVKVIKTRLNVSTLKSTTSLQLWESGWNFSLWFHSDAFPWFNEPVMSEHDWNSSQAQQLCTVTSTSCFLNSLFLLLFLFCVFLVGGTNESDHSESPSVRKCLRKTRGELLLREYEVQFIMLHDFIFSQSNIELIKPTDQWVYPHKNVILTI